MGGTARGSAEPVVPFDADRPAVEAARRDPRAFEPLYRKYVAQIYSFAVYETRDRSVAEDVTEQVFLRALAALPRFREQGEGVHSTFRAWLFTIARKYAITQLRKRNELLLDDNDVRRHQERGLGTGESVSSPLSWISDRELLLFIERLPELHPSAHPQQ